MTEYRTPDDRWLVFYDHPRMASVAVKDALKRSPGTVRGHASHAPIPGSTVNDSVTRRSRELAGMAKSFCIVRDPRDVMATWYSIQTDRGIRIDDVGEMIRSFSQDFGQYCPHGRLFYMEPLCDYVLCYERLERDWQILSEAYDLAPLDRVNVTPNKRPWQELFAHQDEVAVLSTFFADFYLWSQTRNNGELKL